MNHKDEIMDVTACADMLAGLAAGGQQHLKEHIEDFHEILLHVLAGDLVTEPLIDLLKFHPDREATIQKYCDAIEAMWKNGDDAVVNVVDVTILERLSDEEQVWQKFGAFLSDEFRRYINEEALPLNTMMAGVKPL